MTLGGGGEGGGEGGERVTGAAAEVEKEVDRRVERMGVRRVERRTRVRSLLIVMMGRAFGAALCVRVWLGRRNNQSCCEIDEIGYV
jgi:hypothetical protein